MRWPASERFRVVGESGGGAWPPPFENVDMSDGLYRRSDLPFILNPDGHFDVELNAFWSDSHGAVLKTSSLLLYARHVAAFLDFIWYARSPDARRRTWREVTAEDRAAYFYWRNVDSDGPRIVSSTWNNEVVAIDQFFTFQVAVGNLTSSPIRKVSMLRPRPHGNGQSSKEAVGELRRPKKANAPWFTPKEYRTWCDVGLRGYLPTGTRDASYRGEQSARNATFADLVFGVGLRLTEQASLLESEVPRISTSRMYSRLDVAAAVAKNESSRFVLVSQRSIRSVRTYQSSDRAEAVEKAQGTGTYELLADKILVDDGDTFVNASGRRIRATEAAPAERVRLFRQTSDGLEPLALWLTESGIPMKPRTWQRIFADANSRVARLGVPLRCNVHKLRHSWATITLAQLQRRYNHYRSGVAEGTAIGDPLNWVSRRLGHRWIETTMIYIHNLNELEAETILALIPDSLDLVASPESEDLAIDVRGLRIG